MASTTAAQLYPYSSQEKQAIPLEIVRPVAMKRIDLTELTVRNLTLEVDFRVGWIWSSTDSYIKFGGDPLTADLGEDAIPNAMFIPADTVVSCVFEAGPISVMAELDGYMMLNAVEQWASLLQTQQLQQG